MPDIATVHRAVVDYLGPKAWAAGVIAMIAEDDVAAREEILKATPGQKAALVAEVERQSEIAERFRSGAVGFANSRGCSLVIREVV